MYFYKNGRQVEFSWKDIPRTDIPNEVTSPSDCLREWLPGFGRAVFATRGIDKIAGISDECDESLVILNRQFAKTEWMLSLREKMCQPFKVWYYSGRANNKKSEIDIIILASESDSETAENWIMKYSLAPEKFMLMTYDADQGIPKKKNALNSAQKWKRIEKVKNPDQSKNLGAGICSLESWNEKYDKLKDWEKPASHLRTLLP